MATTTYIEDKAERLLNAAIEQQRFTPTIPRLTATVAVYKIIRPHPGVYEAHHTFNIRYEKTLGDPTFDGKYKKDPKNINGAETFCELALSAEFAANVSVDFIVKAAVQYARSTNTMGTNAVSALSDVLNLVLLRRGGIAVVDSAGQGTLLHRLAQFHVEVEA
jgi:hypothetical protein